MKVIILTEGGKERGFGHITRCMSLADAFEQKNIEPEFIISGDTSVEDVLIDRKFRIYKWEKSLEQLSVLVKDADAVIVDSYKAPLELYREMSRNVRMPVYLDDNIRLDYPSGIVANGTIGSQDYNYPVKNGIRYLLGVDYVPLRKEFWNIENRKKINDNIQNILVMLGGTEQDSIYRVILGLLSEYFPDASKQVVSGGTGNARLSCASQGKTEYYHRLKADRMKSLMHKADMAVSGAGQTLYELARMGVPTIAVLLAENQKGNIQGWEKEGFIEYAGRYDDKDLGGKIEKCIEKIRIRDKRIKMSEKGASAVDGRGAARIVDEILTYRAHRCVSYA